MDFVVCFMVYEAYWIRGLFCCYKPIGFGSLEAFVLVILGCKEEKKRAEKRRELRFIGPGPSQIEEKNEPEHAISTPLRQVQKSVHRCLDRENILEWHSADSTYLDTKSNGEYLRKCIFDGPYLPTNVLIAAVEAAENILPVAAHEEVETIHNMTAENKLYFQAEKEAIFLILRLAPVPQRSNAPSYKQSSSTRSTATTRHKGKEIAKPVTPQSESVSEEDSDPEQARRDKDMQKNLALLAKKPKRVKDYAYHKEKMMMCKQAEQGVPLQAEQADWLEDTDEEIDEQELEAHYSYMAKIQEVSPAESSSTDTPLEQKDDSNVIPDSSNICTNDNQVDQNATESVDERVALANLIANLTLDTEENKTVLKQLKKANASLTQELKECKTNLLRV
ncbi:hypothetical protein Tco_0805806 [Tanacetum coccineum]